MRIGSALLMVALVVSASASADDKDKKIDAAKLVGKWEVTKATQPIPPGSVIEFTKDGKVILSGKTPDGQDFKLEGKYKLDGDKLNTKIDVMGQESEDTDTVKKLTDDEMELENGESKTINLKRKK